MFKKYSTLILIVSVFNSLFCAVSLAQTQVGQNSRATINIKNTVAKVGTEPNRKIKVTLNDGTKLKGYITEIKDDYFALLDTKSGKVVSVEYVRVAEVKRDGLSKIATIFITFGVVMGVAIGLSAIALAHDR